MNRCAAGLIGLVACAWASAETIGAETAAEATACPEVRIPASSEWPKREGQPTLSLEADLDGDHRADTLIAEASEGSSFASVIVTTALADGLRSEVVVEDSFYSMLTETAVPAELLPPGRACVLAAVEKAAFGTLERDADPSLEWLLAETKSLHWIEGPPLLPRSYTVRISDEDGAHWTSYKGLLHAYKEGQGPLAPAELARQGDRVLLGTSHGVILTNPERSRHAWIYVSVASGQKLRHPTIRAARIVDGAAVISLEPAAATARSPVVRVDLETGRFL